MLAWMPRSSAMAASTGRMRWRLLAVLLAALLAVAEATATSFAPMVDASLPSRVVPPDERPLPRIGHRPRREDDSPMPTPAATVSATEWRPTRARDPRDPDVGDIDIEPAAADGSGSRVTDSSESGSGSAFADSMAPYTIALPCAGNEEGELGGSDAPMTDASSTQGKKTMRASPHSMGLSPAPSSTTPVPTSSQPVESPSATPTSRLSSPSRSPRASGPSSPSSGSSAGDSDLVVESLSESTETLCAGSSCVSTTGGLASSAPTAAEAGSVAYAAGADAIPSSPDQPAGVPLGIPSTTSPVVETPYRSTYCRCREDECQNEFPGDSSSDICEPQHPDGTCPVGFSKCVATSSYRVQISPTTPNSVADVTFSLLASDIAGAFHNLGDQNPVTSGKNWWLAFRLPTGWRFVSWTSTVVRVQITNSSDATASFVKTFQLHPCSHVTHESNCRGTVNADNVGFVAVKDMLQDWQSIVAFPDKAPLTFQLEKSVVSGPLNSSGQVDVYLVYERNAAATASASQNRRMTVRELYVTAGSASSGSKSSVGVSGNLTAVALANMQAPAIDKGRLYSSLLWIEVQKRKATLSFSTSTVIGRTSNNPKVCINLRPSACSLRGRTPTANATFTDSASAAYVKEGNPFLKYYVSPGDASLAVEQVNDTYFCVDKLLPTGIDPVSTWEISKEFTFQLYVQGILWASGVSKASTMSAGVPTLAEIALIDRGVVQGTDCAQLIVHDQSTSNHGLSVYSVMSVTIYSVAFVGAVLITRMNGITFSALTFYNDMTSVSVIIIFLLSIVGNTIWINVSGDVQTTNASHIYYLTRILASCFTWTMMVSVCFHWTTVLYHDVRKFRRVYLMLIFMIFNIGFFAYGLFALISMSDFFKCAYDDYLKNPKYDRRMCDTDYCPDLQPSQWKYAATQICKAVPYSSWYFATAFGTEILTFLASLALLVLGTYVLQRGSRLIEHSGNLLDDRIVAVMRNSLKTYLIVILAITISLGLATLINVILYTSDWSMNAIVWYTLTIWLPTVIPPAGFLILQWNPRLHGISWNHSSAGAPSKDRRDTKDDEAKRALGRISTYGRLSEGWAGITDFPDTDYLPIGAETNQGCQQLLTLSAQLATPVTISHACYMELYVGETDSNDVTGADFDFGLPGRPRGSVSAMIQTGLLRESMIVQRKNSRSNSTLLQSMATTNMTWTRMGCTETVLPMLVQANGGPSTQIATFMSTLQIPVMPPTAVFRFVVYEIPDSPLGSPSSASSDVDSTDAAIPVRMTERAARASISGMSMAPPSRPRVFCEFSCPASQFVNSDQVQLVAPQGSHRVRHFSSASVNNEPGLATNPVLRIRSTTVSTRTLKDGNGFYITKCFQFMDGEDMVVEDMTETIFTNEIPRQFLDLLQKERAQDLARAEHDLQAFEEKCRRGLAAGLYDNLIDQIQGENVQTVAQSWLEERCRTRSAYVEAIKECQLLCVDRAEEGLNFKASTEKKSLQLRFLPINLHVQDMWVGPTSDLSNQLSRRTSERIKLYTSVTVGAFAAHCFKFRHGAGVLSMRSRLVKHLAPRAGSDKILLNRNDSGLSDKSQPGQSELEYDWTQSETRADDELKWQIVMRMDMCLSQAVTALVTSFCRNLEAALQHPTNKQFLHVIDSIGFLWQVESLLSTQGKELGMLEDFYAAVEAMKGVTFVLDTAPPAHLPPTLNLHIKDVDLPSVVSARLSGDTKSGSYKIVIGVRCSKDVLATIPSGIRSGRKIPVTSVLFTQGINEMQTLANGSSAKKTTLQQTINHDSFFVLKEYVERYKTFAASVTSIPTADMTVVAGLLEELEDRIVSASKQMVKTKHPKIIQQSSRLCRMLSAGRVTSCKSAKDRTSMSVTLEQGGLLCEYHGLPVDSLVPTVSTMRSNGVRIENAYKNTGKRQYAFNALQRSLLPDEYKCPEGTYGRGNVS